MRTGWFSLGVLTVAWCSVGCHAGASTGRTWAPLEPTAATPAPEATAAPIAVDSSTEVVAFAPRDLSTAVFDGTPEVVIPRSLTSGLSAESLAAAIELVTWPERTRVETEHRTLQAETTYGPVRVALLPAHPLEDRWYAVRGPLPTGVSAGPDLVRDADGTYVARFRVGHQLIVQDSQVTLEPDGSHTARVTYSERVTADDAGSMFSAEVDGVPVTAVLLNAAEFRDVRGTNVAMLRLPRGLGSRVRVIPVGLPHGLDSTPLTEADGSPPMAVDIAVGSAPRVSVRAAGASDAEAIPRAQSVGRTVSTFGL